MATNSTKLVPVSPHVSQVDTHSSHRDVFDRGSQPVPTPTKPSAQSFTAAFATMGPQLSHAHSSPQSHFQPRKNGASPGQLEHQPPLNSGGPPPGAPIHHHHPPPGYDIAHQPAYTYAYPYPYPPPPPTGLYAAQYTCPPARPPPAGMYSHYPQHAPFAAPTPSDSSDRASSAATRPRDSYHPTHAPDLVTQSELYHDHELNDDCDSPHDTHLQAHLERRDPRESVGGIVYPSLIRKRRRRTTPAELAVLEGHFARNALPTQEEREIIASELSM